MMTNQAKVLIFSVQQVSKSSLARIGNDGIMNWFHVLDVLEHGTSISLYSPLFELKFGTNTPWYVTPSPLQLVFLLVASLVSI